MPRLCLVTALAAESRPWLDALKLRQISAPPLRLYGSDSVLLLETGVGKLAAAANVGALLQTHTDITHLLNVGIAGGSATIGSLHMAQQVVDVATGAQWFPHMPPRRLIARMQYCSVHTIDAPRDDYQANTLFDMEASAIFSAAIRYLSSSQLHCIKVVSDNPTNPIETITKARINELLHSAIPPVQQLIDELLNLPGFDDHEQQAALRELVDVLAVQVRHTANDKQQLQRLLARYRALNGQLPLPDQFKRFDHAKALRESLQAQLADLPFTYHES